MQFFLATMLALAMTVVAAHNSTKTSGTTSESTVRCSADNPTVWVNTETHVYHMKGSPYYGNTAHGKYMCKRSAVAAHNHEAKNEKNSSKNGMPAPEATK